jgi:anaerobic magnesium-protoporphyrin IX monomethyl ester cyclase
VVSEIHFRRQGASVNGRLRQALPGGRVTLVKPPLRVPTTAYGTLRCPPIGLAYIAAVLEERGFAVSIVDGVGEKPEQIQTTADPHFVRVGLGDDEILERIPRDTTILGVSCMFSEEWPFTRGVIEALRRAFPNVPIVAGGEHITAVPEFSMRNCPAIDACVMGEGEESFAELVGALRTGKPIDDIAGVCYMDGGMFRQGTRRQRIREIDSIPRPAWHLAPLANYLDNGFGFGIGRIRSYPILASRGCPFQCTFCSSPEMWTTRWLARDPTDVLDEMGWAIETYKVDNFDFYDLTAIVRKDWIREFCRLLIERNYKTSWQLPTGTRSEALSDDVLPLLHKSGCSYLVYAPESGSPAVLTRIKKKVHLDRMKQSMRQAVEAGLTVKCNFVVGFPGETRRELWETVNFCSELASIGIHDINVGPFCPYPGSELFVQLQREGRLGQMDDQYFEMLAVYADLTRSQSWTEHVSHRQLLAFRHLAMAAFYARSFARRPQRLFSLVHNVYTGRHQTRLDRNVGDILNRWTTVVPGLASRGKPVPSASAPQRSAADPMTN